MEGPTGPVLSGVRLEDVQAFSAAVQDLRGEVAENSAPWRDILVVYALVNPQDSKAIVLRGMEPAKKIPHTLIDFSFWLQAAWEVYKVTGDKDFLRTIQSHADTIMDQSESKMDAQRTYYPVKKDFEFTQMAMAQAWRVLGYSHGVTRFPGRAVYCEQHFQKLRAFLEKRQALQGLSDKTLELWAQHWNLRPNVQSPIPWSPLVSGPANAVTFWVRDTFGVGVQPFHFDFNPALDCSKKMKPRLVLPYRKGSLDLKIETCGQTLHKTTVDGKRADLLIISDIDHDLKINFYLQ